MSDGVTLRQIVDLFKGQIAWMRVYPNGQREEHQDCMSWTDIRQAVNAYGDRAVWQVFPGYGFIMVYLD